MGPPAIAPDLVHTHADKGSCIYLQCALHCTSMAKSYVSTFAARHHGHTKTDFIGRAGQCHAANLSTMSTQQRTSYKTVCLYTCVYEQGTSHLLCHWCCLCLLGSGSSFSSSCCVVNCLRRWTLKPNRPLRGVRCRRPLSGVCLHGLCETHLGGAVLRAGGP